MGIAGDNLGMVLTAWQVSGEDCRHRRVCKESTGQARKIQDKKGEEDSAGMLSKGGYSRRKEAEYVIGMAKRWTWWR